MISDISIHILTKDFHGCIMRRDHDLFGAFQNDVRLLRMLFLGVAMEATKVTKVIMFAIVTSNHSFLARIPYTEDMVVGRVIGVMNELWRITRVDPVIVVAFPGGGVKQELRDVHVVRMREIEQVAAD